MPPDPASHGAPVGGPVTIVGAGIVGICAASWLIRDGHDVTVIDQQPRDWRSCPGLVSLGQFDPFLAQWEGRGPEPWVFAKARPAAG